MARILVTDNLSKEGVEVFKKAGFEVDVNNDLTPETLLEVIPDYDAVVIRSKTKITAEVIQKGQNLKVIGRAGVGLDNVDIPEATKQGIAVMNTPGGNSNSTAEHTLSMIFSLMRNIPQAHCSMKEKKWEKKKFVGREMHGKKLGVIGLGKIGKIVAKKAKAMGVHVLAYDAFISEETVEKMGLTYSTFETIIRDSDIITVHTPLNDDTRGLISKEEFKYMKEGAYVVNCARGGIIDEKDLIEALDSGKIAGAAIDVYTKEPPEEWELAAHPKVVATPHLGASTKEAQITVAIQVAEQIECALKEQVFINAVNVPALDKETLLKMDKYIQLGEKLGYIAGQLVDEAIYKIKVRYSGEELGKEDVSPVTTAIAKGLLDHIHDIPANYINAPELLKEWGIEVVESKVSEVHDYAHLITVQLQTKKGHCLVGGTTFGKNDPRLVRIDDYLVDISLKGNILYIINEDKPGFIGAAGSYLGKEGINIGFMSVGRREKGTNALTLMVVDEEISPDQLKAIVSIPQVEKVRLIKA